MNAKLLDQIVNAVLYEGYILYPYRPSAKKNARGRFTFGRVYPEAYSLAQHGAEPCVMQTECLLQCDQPVARLEVSVRFLQPTWREVGRVAANARWTDEETTDYRVVPELEIGGTLHQTWQEAVEREITLSPQSLEAGRKCETTRSFGFAAARTLEPLKDEHGNAAGVLVRRQEALSGTVNLTAQPVAPNCFKLTVQLLNQTRVPQSDLEDSDAVLLRMFASAHTILHAPGSHFISLTDPGIEHQTLVDDCQNIGTWPVLVGDETQGDRDTVLSSPIILSDYPRVAPESDGDFGDATEIDEMLTLRVLTMTEAEQREMRSVDGFARQILERTQNLSPEHFMNMHGTMRDVKAAEEFFNPGKQIQSARVNGVDVKAGDKVRLCPKQRADAFDLMLAGKTAVVEAVEQDAEDIIHLAVVLEDDPGKDLGMLRQPGHRFFYRLDEIEPLPEVTV